MGRALTTRQEAIEELERQGIMRHEIYLVDALPLIEMAWADGQVQLSERSMILAFLEDHLTSLKVDAGCEVVTRRQALEFVDRFTTIEPTRFQFSTWRELLKVLRLAPGPDQTSRTQAILEGSLSVGGVAMSPLLNNVAWDPREVECMWRLEDSLKDPDK